MNKKIFIFLIIFILSFVSFVIAPYAPVLDFINSDGECEKLSGDIYVCDINEEINNFIIFRMRGSYLYFQTRWLGFSMDVALDTPGLTFETGEIEDGVKYKVTFLKLIEGNMFNKPKAEFLVEKINYPGTCESLVGSKHKRYKCRQGESTPSGSIVVENIDYNAVQIRVHSLKYAKELSPILNSTSLWILENERGAGLDPQSFINIIAIKDYDYVIFEISRDDPRLDYTCIDSDGGLDFYTHGHAKVDGGWAEDYCLTDTRLEEAFCKDNRPSKVMYTCPENCVGGKCINKSAIPVSERTIGRRLLDWWGSLFK